MDLLLPVGLVWPHEGLWSSPPYFITGVAQSQRPVCRSPICTKTRDGKMSMSHIKGNKAVEFHEPKESACTVEVLVRSSFMDS